MLTLRRYAAIFLAAMVALPVMALASPAADAQQGNTNFVLYGEAGDYISQGNDVAYAESSDVSFAPSVNFNNGVSVMIDVTNDGAFVERWTANFAAPGDVALESGDAFSNATRFPFQSVDEAGLSVTGAGRGCNQSAGEFRVHEVSISPDGTVDTFAIDFRQSCDGGIAIVGGVRVNSTVPTTDPDFTIDPQPPVDTTAPDADAGLIQTGRIKRQSSNFFVDASCTDDNPGAQLISADINGVAVSPGQKVKLTISNRERVTSRKGNLSIQSATIILTVTCEDAAGNTAVDTAQPSYD